MAEEKTTIQVIQAQMRSVDALIGLAKSGDNYAARKLLSDFVLRHDLGKPVNPRLIKWLVACFSEVITNEKTADVALGLKPGAGKRGGQKKNIQEQYHEAGIAEMVASELNRGELQKEGKITIEEATETVSEMYKAAGLDVSDSKTKKAYLKYNK